MKKFLIALLVFTICACSALSFVGCGNDTAENGDAKLMAIYGTYVAYAQENAVEPLSYEEWLDSIKGQNGKDGKDGIDGKDGLSIKSVEVNEEGKLIITFTDNTFVDAGKVKGDDGKNGQNGKDGVGIADMKIENGKLYVKYTNSDHYVELGQVKGENGKDGTNGKDGQDGINGTTPTIEVSADGYWVIGGIKTDAKAVASDGKDGVDGQDGKDGKSAYQIWLDNGHEGTEEDFLSWIKGGKDNPYNLAFYLLDDGTYGVGAGYAGYLSNIIVPATYRGKDVTMVVADGFKNAKIKTISLPETITYIAENAFSECVNLETVTFNGKVVSIGDYAFNNCGKLQSFVVPETCETVGEKAFFGCVELVLNVTPDSLCEIEAGAFTSVKQLIWNDDQSTSWTVTVESIQAWIYPYLPGDIGTRQYRTVYNQSCSVTINGSNAQSYFKDKKTFTTDVNYNSSFGNYKMDLVVGNYKLTKTK